MRVLLLLLAALAIARPAAALVVVPPPLLDSTFVKDLDAPTNMAFLPDGRLLITEQHTGRVRMIVANQVAATDPVLTVPNLFGPGYENGLQGIAVDPGWPARPFVYLFYDRTGGFLRLVRYTASGDLDDPGGQSLSLSDSLILIDDIPDQTPRHQAGCLRFGPDRRLYLSLGDDEVGLCLAQDSTSLHGAIIRMSVDALPPGPGGQVPRALLVPPGNPLSTSDSNARLVWAYGMRNPWRLQIDPATGTVYAADVGEVDYEEINEVLPGDNLGWPFREGPLVHEWSYCPEPGGTGSNTYKPPILAMPHLPGSTAIDCAGIYRPSGTGGLDWPAIYDGDLFYCEYYTGFMRRLKYGGATWSPAPPEPGQPDSVNWGIGFNACTDFQIGPDGALWWLQQYDDAFSPQSGTLHRLAFCASCPLSAPPPTARAGELSAAPNPFLALTEIRFSSATAGHVRLAIYDLAGRRIRGLLDGEAPAGPSRLQWDGRDDSGRPVAAGLYLARLTTPGHPAAAQTIRVLRLR